MPREELAQLFMAACKRAGFDTVYAINKETDISTSTLDAIKYGTSSPTVETLERIMDVIGCDVVIKFRPRK